VGIIATTTQDLTTAREFLEKIKNGIPVENVIVNEDIDFPTSSEDRRINSKLKVNDCTFMGRVNLSLIFEQEVDFSGSVFFREVSFYKSHFDNFLCFSKRHDDGFKFSKFKDSIEFMEVEFQNVDFERVEFDSDVDFRDAKFSGIFDISSARFKGIAEFDALNLYHEQPQFGEGCKIRLNDASFFRLMVHWKDIKDHIEAANPPDYSTLIKNYAELGWFDDADDCYLAYKNLFWEADYLDLYSGYVGTKKRIKK